MAGNIEKRSRIASIDALRGLVMIVMALDHVRDFLHVGAMSFRPEDLTRTTTALFFTRWITHICAPVFMFSAGLGAFFWLNSGHTKSQLSRFLWTRGLWLAFLDAVVVQFGFRFSFGSGPVILNVLWALGWCMVILSVLIHLPIRILAPLSIAVIALHNLADNVNPSQFGSLGWMWTLVHQPGLLPIPGATVVVAYPLVPWFAVMAAGFCFGPIFNLDPDRRQRRMVGIGLGLTIAFLVVRGINIYGDPVRWSSEIPGMTVLSFLRCTKYPPSLDFLLMTLGPALLLLAGLDRINTYLRRANPLMVFGRVPLFYFMLHLYLIHLLAFPLALFRYGRAGFLFTPAPSMGGAANVYPADYGYSLGVVYLLWILVVILLYPLCLWFARLKERRKDWWLSYL
jgi:uncharacterized membrane protein